MGLIATLNPALTTPKSTRWISERAITPPPYNSSASYPFETGFNGTLERWMAFEFNFSAITQPINQVIATIAFNWVALPDPATTLLVTGFLRKFPTLDSIDDITDATLVSWIEANENDYGTLILVEPGEEVTLDLGAEAVIDANVARTNSGAKLFAFGIGVRANPPSNEITVSSNLDVQLSLFTSNVVRAHDVQMRQR